MYDSITTKQRLGNYKPKLLRKSLPLIWIMFGFLCLVSSATVLINYQVALEQAKVAFTPVHFNYK